MITLEWCPALYGLRECPEEPVSKLMDFIFRILHVCMNVVIYVNVSRDIIDSYQHMYSFVAENKFPSIIIKNYSPRLSCQIHFGLSVSSRKILVPKG